MILAAVFTKKWAAIRMGDLHLFLPVVVVGKVAYFIFRQRSWSLALTLVNAIVAFFRSFQIQPGGDIGLLAVLGWRDLCRE